MKRLIGLIGSWAVFVLALGLAAFAIAGETINLRDARRLDRVEVIDQMIRERSGSKADVLRDAAAKKTAGVNALQAKLKQIAAESEDLPDSSQTIIVSTAENKLYV